MGSGPGEPGAVWAAARIPDDHVGVSANIPRISEINLKDPDHYMASDNVYSLAEKMGWWKQGEAFKFWKAYSGRKPFADRELDILSTLAPDLNLKREAEELPFSVKPAHKLSVQDVMKYYRETYEGTDMDPTKNLMTTGGRGAAPPAAGAQPQDMVKSPAANPWMGSDMARLLNTLKPGAVQTPRTIAITGCAYSQIIQVRDWMPDDIGAIAWFSFDNPAQSPRMPIFSSVLSLPKSFEVDAQKRYREDSACWAFRKVNRLAMIKWGATRRIMEGAVAEFETKAFTELPAIEKIAQDLLKTDPSGKKTREFLTQYTNDFARATMNSDPAGKPFSGYVRQGILIESPMTAGGLTGRLRLAAFALSQPVAMSTLLPTLVVFLLYLLWERVALDRARGRISIRIAVTGTRGKLGVVRLLASILREDGRRVVAKTTGSEAIVLMPDGSQIQLDRSTGPSILEQKQLIHRAARARADCLVAEVMSIRAENHFVESRQLLNSNIVAITNVRKDHTDLMERNREKDRLRAQPRHHPPLYRFHAGRRTCRRLPPGGPPVQGAGDHGGRKFLPGISGRRTRPAKAGVCRKPRPGMRHSDHLGISRERISEGIRKAHYDIGGLAMWRHPDRDYFFVNAFAANDPESTFRVLDRVSAALPAMSGSVVGVMNLRADRMPRTLQWLDVFQKGTHRFRQLVVVGEFTRAVERRLPHAQFLRIRKPETIMQSVYIQAPEPAIIFGFGNVKGMGRTLIGHWSTIGMPYAPAGTTG